MTIPLTGRWSFILIHFFYFVKMLILVGQRGNCCQTDVSRETLWACVSP